MTENTNRQEATTMDPNTANLLRHPLRGRILAAIGHGERSPADLSRELDARIGNVSYHVRFLLGTGQGQRAGHRPALKLVDTRPRRGAVEHFYGLTTYGLEVLEAARRVDPVLAAAAAVDAFVDELIGRGDELGERLAQLRHGADADGLELAKATAIAAATGATIKAAAHA